MMAAFSGQRLEVSSNNSVRFITLNELRSKISQSHRPCQLLGVRLQNHPLARVVEDDSELAQNFHANVSGETALDGRAFEEIVRLWFVHGEAAQLELGDRTDLCLRVAAHADPAAIG